jgi:hypothetical protein
MKIATMAETSVDPAMAKPTSERSQHVGAIQRSMFQLVASPVASR